MAVNPNCNEDWMPASRWFTLRDFRLASSATLTASDRRPQFRHWHLPRIQPAHGWSMVRSRWRGKSPSPGAKVQERRTFPGQGDPRGRNADPWPWGTWGSPEAPSSGDEPAKRFKALTGARCHRKRLTGVSNRGACPPLASALDGKSKICSTTHSLREAEGRNGSR